MKALFVILSFVLSYNLPTPAKAAGETTTPAKPAPAAAAAPSTTQAPQQTVVVATTPIKTECQEAYEEYREANKEKGQKCGKVGGCDGSGSSKFSRCQKFVHSSDEDEEYNSKLNTKEMLAECPFFAKDESERAEKEEEALDKRVKENEDEIQEITKEMKEAQEENTKRTGELQKEIGEAQGEASEALAKVGEQISSLQKGSTKQINAIREQLRALQEEVDKKRVDQAAQATAKYREAVSKIHAQCQEVALSALTNEVKALKQGNVSAAKQRQQIAAGGALNYLKLLADAEFRKCQQSRLFKDQATNLKDVYEANIQSINLDVRRQAQLMAELKNQHDQLVRSLPQEMQQIQQRAMAEAETANNKVMALKQELQQTMQQQYMTQAQYQQRIIALQKVQFDQKRNLQTIKAKIKDTKSVSPGMASREDFFEALEAYGRFKEAKIEVDAQCCAAAKAGGANSTIRSKSVCLTDEEKEEWGASSSADSDAE